MIGTAGAALHAQEHAFTVTDDIEMTRFSDPLPVSSIAGTEIVHCSPDGKYFAVVTTRGLLESDEVESEISIFDSETASAFLESTASTRPPRPRVIATITSFPHHEEPIAYAPVIKDLRWSSDSSRIYFKGENLQGGYRLYRAKIDGGAVQALTPARYSVIRYDVAGDTVVYRGSQLVGRHVMPKGSVSADAQQVTGERLQDILFPDELRDLAPQNSTLRVIQKLRGTYSNLAVPNSFVRERTQTSNRFAPFSISPDGRGLIELVPADSVPRSWESYEPAIGFEQLRYRTSDPRLTKDDNILRPQRYTLFDLTRGTETPLVDAPNAFTLVYGEANRVLWAADGQHVLVTNTFLPLEHIALSERTERLRPCAVASVDIRTLEVHCVIFNSSGEPANTGGLHVVDLAFGENPDEVVLQIDISRRTNLVQRYRYRDGQWRLVTIRQTSKAPEMPAAQEHGENKDLQLRINQALNDPPTLWVLNKRTGQSRQLWDPNPQLAHIRFGDVSVYRWKDKTGYEWTGGLVRPVGYVPGKRYPLVIQMYMFADGQFMTDGTDPTAFAARHLASAGFVVLQIQKKPTHTYDDKEAQDHLEGYRSAIEQLADEGLVDTRRVGAVGFSWTSWYVENALIKAPHLFAAATIADGVDHSYMDYHLFGVSSPVIQEQDDRIIGAKPIGDGLKRWWETAPGFHLDRVQTPLRIEAIDPLSLLGEWEIYSSLRLQDKPVDLIYFPFGTHIHQKPLERLESQQGNVDWFRFWLQGYEDPAPAKRGQYERWESLRKDGNVDAAVTP
jgi:dipeptidyl aminopeptidase/acylaminoacyl peptidase